MLDFSASKVLHDSHWPLALRGLSHPLCTAAAFQVKYCSRFATAACSVSVTDSPSALIKFSKCEQFAPELPPIAFLLVARYKMRPLASTAGTEMAERKRNGILCFRSLQTRYGRTKLLHSKQARMAPQPRGIVFGKDSQWALAGVLNASFAGCLKRRQPASKRICKLNSCVLVALLSHLLLLCFRIWNSSNLQNEKKNSLIDSLYFRFLRAELPSCGCRESRDVQSHPLAVCLLQTVVYR